MTSTISSDRLDWRTERDRIDLVSVATNLLGPPPGRRGERGRKLWWPCPFHPDANPSFVIDPGSLWWKCHGCGEHGDAASLVMRLGGLTFPEAIRRLTGGPLGRATDRSSRRPTPPPVPDGPKGLPPSVALALVAEAEARLWSSEGAEALDHLVNHRHLTEDTIRPARLGWTPGTKLLQAAGGSWTARGVVIPWFDGNRLTLVKVRQPDGSTPKYAEAYRNRPSVLIGIPGTARPGMPLVAVEGEFDALLLGQELSGLAVVLTFGPASVYPDLVTLSRFVVHPRWFTAHDADLAGDKAAEAWPAHQSSRVRPPASFKDWTEAKQGGVNLRRWWTDRLGGIEAPDLFTWTELAAWRWGPFDSLPGIIIDQPDPERRRIALASLGTGPGDAHETQEGETP